MTKEEALKIAKSREKSPTKNIMAELTEATDPAYYVDYVAKCGKDACVDTRETLMILFGKFHKNYGRLIKLAN